jgi:hypothetical protein
MSLVVGDDKDRDAAGGEPDDERLDGSGGAMVEPRGGFVEEERAGVTDERPRHGHPCGLSARELGRRAAEERLGLQPGCSKRVGEAPRLGIDQPEREVRRHRARQHHRPLRHQPHAPAQHTGIELAHVAPVEIDPARCRGLEKHQGPQQACLPRPRRPQQCGDGIRRDLEVDGVEHAPVAAPDGQSVRGEPGTRGRGGDRGQAGSIPVRALLRPRRPAQVLLPTSPESTQRRLAACSSPSCWIER